MRVLLPALVEVLEAWVAAPARFFVEKVEKWRRKKSWLIKLTFYGVQKLWTGSLSCWQFARSRPGSWYRMSLANEKYFKMNLEKRVGARQALRSIAFLCVGVTRFQLVRISPGIGQARRARSGPSILQGR